MIAAIEAQGWVIIIAALSLSVTQILSMIFSNNREKSKIIRDEATADKVEAVRIQAETAAKHVGEVKVQLEESTRVTGKTLSEIHSWVNSLMGKALQTIATLKREKAERTRNAADEFEAKEAEALYAAHMAQQKKIDAKA